MKKLQEIEGENPDYYDIEYGDPLLDYVYLMAEEFNPLTVADMQSGHYKTKGYGTFTHRYFDKKLDTSFEQSFQENKEVQESIKALGYDVDKFWYLLLFVYDYCRGMCENGIVLKKSPKRQLENFSNSIIENIESYNSKVQEVALKSPTKIVLEIDGNRKVTIQDPIAILYLAGICIKELDNVDAGSLMTLNRAKVNFKNGRIIGETESNSVHIWYFAKMLNKFFDLEPYVKARQKKGSTVSFSRKLLISRLIFVTGLSNNINLLDSDDTLKAYLNQYKNHKLNTINSIYW
ncbi:MAG TPA: hypothetical protein VFP20_00270 [Bacteroidales bacterium]|nr:hypothetical protein [Bacteroidales bacterium]